MQLLLSLKETGKKFWQRLSIRAKRIVIGVLLSLIGLVVLLILTPSKLFSDDYSAVLLDAQNHVIGLSLARDQAWRFPPLAAVPPKFTAAILSFEDKRFFQHWGIDLLAIARATVDNIRHGEVRSGASTLTMQVARMGLQRPNRSLWAKMLEAVVAIKLELVYSKKEILRIYATQAPFGGNIVGIEAASWRYFGRGAADLSWAESATLALLPNAPSLINLSRNRALLKERRDNLLLRMHSSGYFDEDTYKLSIDEKLPTQALAMPRLAPHLLESVLAGLIKAPENTSWPIYQSSIQRQLQVRSSELLAEHLRGLQSLGITNGAVLILDNTSNTVLAYVGNNPLLQNQSGSWVDIIQRPRSTGSLLKPFLYAAMLDEGQLLPSQLVADIPTRYPGFAPENHTQSFQGALPAYEFLARSLNVPAVRLLQEYNLQKFATLLKKLGMTTLIRQAEDYGLPLIIGGAEGTLWELCGMYSSLARNALGQHLPYTAPSPWPTGSTNSGTEVFSQAAAYLTLDAMVKVNRPGHNENWQLFSSSQRIAWKTGTSQGNRDAWAIGVSRDYTVGIWIGNADGEARPELAGTAVAGPLLFSLFEQIPEGQWFPVPHEDLQEIEVCVHSGLPPGPHCESFRTELVPSNAHLPEPCPYCQTLTLTADGKQRTTMNHEGGNEVLHQAWFILPPVMEWYYTRSHPDYQPPPPFKSGVQQESTNIGIVYPENNSRIFIPKEFDGLYSKIVAEAVHRIHGKTVFWHLNESYIGTSEYLHTKEFYLPAGKHTLTLIDELGEIAQCRFEVLARE